MRSLPLKHVIIILWGVCFFKLPIGICQTNIDSTGIYLLEKAYQLQEAKKLKEANQIALSAIDYFSQTNDWSNWIEGYDVIYYNARKTNLSVDLLEAIEVFGNAEIMLKEKHDFSETVKARVYGRIAYLYHNLGQYWEAVTYYQKAFKFAEKAGDDIFLLKLYGSAANAFWLIGDDEKSLNFHNRALTMAYNNKDAAGLIPTITANLANAWRTIDPVKSIQFYQKSLQLNPNDSQTHMLLSKAYLEGPKDGGKALKEANRALELLTKEDEKSDVFHQLGRVAFFFQEYDKALSYYDEALIWAEKEYGKRHPECVKIHFYKGNALLEKNDLEAAKASFNSVLELLLPLFNPTSIDQHPIQSDFTFTSLWILEALNGKSIVYSEKYQQEGKVEDLEEALLLAELGFHYLQKIKLKYGDDESKYQLNDNYFFMCGRAMDYAFELENKTGKDRYLENGYAIGAQTKAVVLSETLYRKELKKISGVPNSLLELERELHGRIAHWEKKIYEENDANVIISLKDSLFVAKRALEDFENQLGESYPKYAKTKFSYKQQSIYDIQQELPEETALIEYFLTDSSIFSFLITRDSFWALSTFRSFDFEKDLTSFLRTISDWEYVEDSSTMASSNFLKHSWRLYQELLKKQLELVDAKNLIIIPDEILSSIPFEVLLSQPYEGSWIDRDVPYLLNDYNISYRFSSTFTPNSNVQSMNDWGGFGLEFNDPEEMEYLEDMGDAIVLRNEGRLLHAADEILNSANFFDGTTWLNDEATRENFLENAEKFEILHLATHAVVDQKDPLRSKIIFSQSIIDEDAAVYAHEIYGMQLKAGLTVLSACSSGRGTWKRGEGMMSLARAFTYAGCPSVVMSLWNVSDKSTSILMIDFYKYLKEGHSKDEALRLAKMDYLKSTSSEYTKPIYWASFVAVGDISPIQPIDDSWSLYYKIILGLLALLLVYFMVSRSNKAS